MRSGWALPPAPSTTANARHRAMAPVTEVNMAVSWIKVCGITNAQDAHLAETAGVDAVGLVLSAGDPRAISIDEAAEIAAGVTVETVVVLDRWNPDLLREVRLAINPTRLQVEGPPPPPDAEIPLPWHQVYELKGRSTLGELRDRRGDRFLLRLPPAFRPPHGNEWRQDRRLLLETGRLDGLVLGDPGTVETVERVCRDVHPFGLDIRSEVETAMGVKDWSLLNAFLEAAGRRRAGRLATPSG